MSTLRVTCHRPSTARRQAPNRFVRERPKNRPGQSVRGPVARQGFCPLVHTMRTAFVPDVFSVAEVARAAGVPAAGVRTLLGEGRIRAIDADLIAPRDAVRAVRMLRGMPAGLLERNLFRPHAAPARAPGRALAASGTLHAAMLGVIALVTSMGLSSAPRETPQRLNLMRLVFLAIPGPGGGGGGGGLRQPAPPPKAQVTGTRALKSPVPPPRRVAPKRPDPEPVRTPPPPPVRPQPVAAPVDPPPAPTTPKPAPQVVAPVATVAGDPRDRTGVLAESASTADSNGPGSGGGAGTGHGTGIGEGDGSGIGPGSGGGTGGGPYRPGSGILAPGLLREVKPDYTEDARRRGIEGDVVLEIIVRSDGGVGSVKVLQGLGAGLDERAIGAVRQWRFSPARRLGTPVDVVVEVAVEFKLR